MPLLSSLATALPPHLIEQGVARDFARHHFAPAFPAIERYLPVFQHALIDTRSLVVPPEWFLEPHSLGACNDLFLEWAQRLGEDAARRCMAQAGLAPSDVDHLIFVSTTGFAAPSVDARLIGGLGMGRHTRRTPIWGLGCAGGVAGLSRAYEYTRAFPAHRALLVVVELCSLTFQWGDFSKRNVIAASLFADGAAAVLVEGDEVAARRGAVGAPTILGTGSTLWPDTLRVMGWDIVDSGMQVVFSPRIPAIVQDLMRGNVEEFLAQYGLALSDISRFVLHPGGARVLRAYEQALGIGSEQIAHSREVLRRHGNMSSATVFFVLEDALAAAPLAPGEHALLAVLGPGFSCELALLRG